jgi:hypothetical protein
VRDEHAGMLALTRAVARHFDIPDMHTREHIDTGAISSVQRVRRKNI